MNKHRFNFALPIISAIALPISSIAYSADSQSVIEFMNDKLQKINKLQDELNRQLDESRVKHSEAEKQRLELKEQLTTQQLQAEEREAKFKTQVQELQQKVKNLQSLQLNNKLIAHYPFNGNANDESGNGNNGIVYGATLTTDRFGNTNSAYGFNGSDDYIDINIPNINTTPGSQVTVSFWMNWYGTNDVMPFGFHRYDLYFNTTYFGFNTSNGDLWGINSNGLANHWTFITAIFNNGNIILSSLYIDGNNRTLAQMIGKPSDRTVSSSAHISGWRYSDNIDYDSKYRFVGKIDDVRIYNSALSAAEIQQLYQEGTTHR